MPGKDGIPGLPGKQVCVLVCVRALLCVLGLFLSGPCLCDHSVICCSGHCWTSRPDGFKGGAGRQWSSREGEIMPNLPNSVGCKDSQWNCFVFLLDAIPAAQYLLPKEIV